MNREERRTEQKARNRKLKSLARFVKMDKEVAKLVAELEDNFEENEIDNAKIFVTDYLFQSGIFKEENINDTLEQAREWYGLETPDLVFLLDLIENNLSPEDDDTKNRTEETGE